MTGIALLLLIFLILIIGHELTHCFVAKLFGFTIPVFGIGLPLGPHLTFGSKDKTEIRIHPLLVGAYTCIPGLDPEEVSGDNQTSSQENSKFPLWQRVTVVLAGSVFYVAISWLILFFSLNIFGEATVNVTVQTLSSSISIASNAGVRAGDIIVAIDTQRISLPDDVVTYLHSHIGKPVTFHIRRQDQSVDVSLTTDPAGKVGMTMTGAGAGQYQRVSFADSFALATQQLCRLTGAMHEMAGAMIAQKMQGQPRGNQTEVHGGPGLFTLGSLIFAKDSHQFPKYVAYISFDLAIINLLPWPGLDGSHLLAIIINAVRKKRVQQPGFLRWIFGFLSGITLLNGVPLCFLRGDQKQR